MREDLWRTALGPLPDDDRPGWLIWRPAIVLLLVPCAVAIGLFGINDLAYALDYGSGTKYAIVLGGIVPAASLVLSAFRPLAAWWAVTAAMLVTALVTASAQPTASLAPWTIPGVAAQGGVLLLLALRVRVRAAAEALALSVLAGWACLPLASPVQVAGAARATAVLAAAVVVGSALRGRQVAHNQLAAQEEITADERARRTLLEERNRIARELHDVVAHHMSVISIQAQVTPHLVENPSEELRENLAGIRANAVDALTELRRVLGVLRSQDSRAEGTRHTPQPDLGRLDELVGNVRGAGLTASLRTLGEPRPLPPGVELSAFRIVQESLSNAMRHAPGAEVRVEIGYHASGLAVRVANTAPARSAPSAADTGHGLLGMRERTAMLGGELAAGATPDGGYEVTAMLPTRPGTAADEPAGGTA